MSRTRTHRGVPKLLTAVLLSAAVLVAPAADLAHAATKTTKKSTKSASKTATKKATRVTTRKTVPAKKAKKVKSLFQPNGRAPLSPPPFVALPVSKDPALPSAPDDGAAFARVQPAGGVFSMLIVGSDARPNEKPEATRADSIHLFLYNAALKKGTLVGFPRDSYVQSQSGHRKITEVLSTAGPDAVLAAVNGVSGIATKRYILTGFGGFTAMVDQVGGVNVLVKPSLNDPISGATFAEGWFTFNGKAALAYSRARKNLRNGDFDRSLNQARVLVYGLARMREQAGELTTLTKWVNIVRRNTITNTPAGDWLYLAQVARGIDPSAVSSIVLPGTTVSIGGSEVVKLNDAKVKAIFADLADGVLTSSSVQAAVPTPTVPEGAAPVETVPPAAPTTGPGAPATTAATPAATTTPAVPATTAAS